MLTRVFKRMFDARSCRRGGGDLRDPVQARTRLVWSRGKSLERESAHHAARRTITLLSGGS